MQIRTLSIWAAALLLLPATVFGDPYAGMTFTIPDVPPAYTGKTNADLKTLVEVPYYTFHDDTTADPIAAYAAEIKFQYDILRPHEDAWTNAKKTDAKAPRSYLSKEELAAYVASWDRVAKYLAVAISEWENLPADTDEDYAARFKIIVDKFAYESLNEVSLYDGETFKGKELKDADWGKDLAIPRGFYGYFGPAVFDADANTSKAIALQRFRRIDFYGYKPVAVSLLTPGNDHLDGRLVVDKTNPERVNPHSIDFLVNKLAVDLNDVVTRDQKLSIRGRLLHDIFAGSNVSDNPLDYLYAMSGGVLQKLRDALSYINEPPLDALYVKANGNIVYRPFIGNSWWPAKDTVDPKFNRNAQDKD